MELQIVLVQLLVVSVVLESGHLVLILQLRLHRHGQSHYGIVELG